MINIIPLRFKNTIRQLSSFTKLNTNTKQNSFTFQYLSDIHVDSKHNVIKYPDVNKVCETLLIAGDIGDPFHENFHVFMKRMSDKFSKVIFVAGNHEYDCGNLFDQNKYNEYTIQMKTIFKQLPNVFFLDNETHQINNNIIIAGTTLWSNPMLNPNEFDKLFYKRKITSDQYNTHLKKHYNCINFIKDVCAKHSNKKIIVLSHFVPTFKLIDDKYLLKGQPNKWFVSDLEHLIKKPIRSWICGHSHSIISKQINNVYCAINAYGHKQENNSSMIKEKTFSI
jgi:hypothetical protein